MTNVLIVNANFLSPNASAILFTAYVYIIVSNEESAEAKISHLST